MTPDDPYHPSSAAENRPDEEEPVRQSPENENQASGDAYRDLGEAVKNAFRAGAGDAKKAARNAVPRVGEEFSKGVHDIAYGLAYLASFGVSIARELTPDPVSDGLREGTEAGRKAAEKVMEKRRRSSEEADRSREEAGGEPEAVPV